MEDNRQTRTVLKSLEEPDHLPCDILTWDCLCKEEDTTLSETLSLSETAAASHCGPFVADGILPVSLESLVN